MDFPDLSNKELDNVIRKEGIKKKIYHLYPPLDDSHYSNETKKKKTSQRSMRGYDDTINNEISDEDRVDIQIRDEHVNPVGLRLNQYEIEFPEIVEHNKNHPIQREDGVKWKKDETQYGGRYKDEWLSEQEKRQKIVENHPDYRFVELVCGFIGERNINKLFDTNDIEYAMKQEKVFEERMKQLFEGGSTSRTMEKIWYGSGNTVDGQYVPEDRLSQKIIDKYSFPHAVEQITTKLGHINQKLTTMEDTNIIEITQNRVSNSRDLKLSYEENSMTKVDIIAFCIEYSILYSLVKSILIFIDSLKSIDGSDSDESNATTLLTLSKNYYSMLIPAIEYMVTYPLLMRMHENMELRKEETEIKKTVGFYGVDMENKKESKEKTESKKESKEKTESKKKGPTKIVTTFTNVSDTTAPLFINLFDPENGRHALRKLIKSFIKTVLQGLDDTVEFDKTVEEIYSMFKGSNIIDLFHDEVKRYKSDTGTMSFKHLFYRQMSKYTRHASQVDTTSKEFQGQKNIMKIVMKLSSLCPESSRNVATFQVHDVSIDDIPSVDDIASVSASVINQIDREILGTTFNLRKEFVDYLTTAFTCLNHIEEDLSNEGSPKPIKNEIASIEKANFPWYVGSDRSLWNEFDRPYNMTRLTMTFGLIQRLRYTQSITFKKDTDTILLPSSFDEKSKFVQQYDDRWSRLDQTEINDVVPTNLRLNITRDEIQRNTTTIITKNEKKKEQHQLKGEVPYRAWSDQLSYILNVMYYYEIIRCYDLMNKKKKLQSEKKELDKKSSDMQSGNIDISDISFPYIHKREWLSRPENGGKLKFDSTLVSCITKAYKRILSIGVGFESMTLEDLQNDDRYRSEFAELIAIMFKLIKLDRGGLAYDKSLEKKLKLDKINCEDKFKTKFIHQRTKPRRYSNQTDYRPDNVSDILMSMYNL